MTINYKQIKKALETQGWLILRQKGSHVVFGKDGKSCPVPKHSNKDIPKGTLANIERVTGVKLR